MSTVSNDMMHLTGQDDVNCSIYSLYGGRTLGSPPML